MKEFNEVWQEITAGLPQTPSPIDSIPLPEILRTIYFCTKEGFEAFDAAIELLDKISFIRNDVQFLNWKAMVEFDCKKYIRSFETTEKILEFQKTPETYFNAGRAAYKANFLEKSKNYLEKCMKLDPENVSAVLDHAVTVCTMGEFDRALDIIENIDKSKHEEKNQKIVDFNKGWHYIRKGRFREGIDLLHIGREINIWGSHSRKYTKPMWDGKTQPGKTILIVGEGGIGDEIINARFSQTIKERGMRPIMSTVHNNISMLSTVKTLDKVINDKDVANTKWDYWVPCMDLPYALKIEAEDVPNDPYISAQKEYINKWASKTKTDKFKIGIRWMGNPRYELELARTLPVESFDEIADFDVQMFSLQKDDGIKNLRLPKNTIDLAPDFRNWDDTMGAIMNMDLIITSCTSVAHVAAALGKPTWVVMPLLPYYTWADMKKESYWYKCVSNYRQKEWKNWHEPFEEVKRDLAQLLENRK